MGKTKNLFDQKSYEFFKEKNYDIAELYIELKDRPDEWFIRNIVRRLITLKIMTRNDFSELKNDEIRTKHESIKYLINNPIVNWWIDRGTKEQLDVILKQEAIRVINSYEKSIRSLKERYGID